MLLTVTVPAYNVEKYIRECLDSFIVPSYAGRFEVLVVNDGSTDGTEAAAREYESKYPDIFRVITKDNAGHGSAINTGIAAAQGKYFKVVDGDDCVDTGAFERYLELLGSVDADLVATNFVCCDAETMKPRSVRRPVISGRHGDGTYRFDDICGDLLVRMHSIAWKTSVLRSGSIFIDEHSYYVDMEYNMFPVPYIETVCLADLSVYKYRLGLGGQSVSLAGLRAHADQHKRVLRRCLEFVARLNVGVLNIGQNSDSRKTIRVTPQKKAYLEKLCAEMAATQHLVFLSSPASENKRIEAMRLDKELAEQHPGVYKANRNKAVAMLRASDYLLYPAARAAVRLLKK